MAVLVGMVPSAGHSLDLFRFFARQPEPDLEFTEDELDQSASARPTAPIKPPKRSGGGRSLLWLLLLVVIGGVAYVAMEPELVTDWLASFMEEGTSRQPTIPAAGQPPSPAAVPSNQGQPTSAEGDVAPSQAPQPLSTPHTPTPGSPAATSVGPQTVEPVPPATPIRAVPSPLFAEGQKVTVIGNPTAPGEPIQMTQDPAGTRPGPSVRPGTTMNILDGDLQPSGWVYSVRTDDGVKGWIAEGRLRLKF